MAIVYSRHGVVVRNGGGTFPDGIMVGTEVPSDDIGNEGDRYFRYHDTIPGGLAIPKLTSDVSQLFWSDTWDSEGAAPFKAFDRDSSTWWTTHLSNNSNQYIGYDFMTFPVEIVGVTILPRVFSGHPQIKDFAVQISAGNSEWTTIYEGTIPDSDEETRQEYYFENDMLARYVRLFVKNVYTSQTITVREINFYKSGTATYSYVDEYYMKSGGHWQLYHTV